MSNNGLNENASNRTLSGYLQMLRKFAERYLWVGIFLVVLFILTDAVFPDLHLNHTLVVSICVVFIISLFTGELVLEGSSASENAATVRHTVRAVLGIGYLFLIAVGCFAFYIMFHEIKPANTQHSNTVSYGPIFVNGCEYSAPEAKEIVKDGSKKIVLPASVPDAVKYCASTPPQRLIIIGSITTECSLTNSCAETKPPIRPPRFYIEQSTCSADILELQAKIELNESINPCLSDAMSQKVSSKLLEAKNKLQAISIQQSLSLKDSSSNNNTSAQEIQRTRDALTTLKQKIEANKLQKAILDQQHSIDNHIDGKLIVGGIVVPAYFVFCALLGAMISMARKLPEFQARIVRKDDDTDNKDFRGESLATLQFQEIPELVLFQIIQVCSAPILAIIAYGYLNDEIMSDFTAISIAFAAGFSSEWVLMMIRNISDRLAGARPKTSLSRAVLNQLPQTVTQVFDGLVKVGDLVYLRKASGKFTPGTAFLVTSIQSNTITATAVDGSGELREQAICFEIKAPSPVFADFSNVDG